MNDILSKFKDIVAETLGISKDDITEDSSVVGDLGADSLDVVEIEMACQNEFGFDSIGAWTSNLNTVADWVEAIGKEIA